jgi:hypothetical protein
MKIWQRKTKLVPYSPLNDDAIKQAFRVGVGTPWFVALMQLLDQYRDDLVQQSIAHLAERNEMGLHAAAGGVKAIEEAISSLQTLREEATAKLT